jgi:hypothetical protein
MIRRIINYGWSCSDYKHHYHRYYWIAYLCGKIQYLFKIRIVFWDYGFIGNRFFDFKYEVGTMRNKRLEITIFGYTLVWSIYDGR